MAGPVFAPVDEETWLPIPGWEPFYEVSSHGRVRSLPRRVESYAGRVGTKAGRILTAFPALDSGHLRVTLNANGRRRTLGVHRLVLLAFVGPCPDGMEGCHNDGDPTNNRPSNLRWDTRENNVRDTLAHGRHIWARQSACTKGHRYTPETTRVTAKGYRVCRICQRDWMRAARARARQEGANA